MKTIDSFFFRYRVYGEFFTWWVQVMMVIMILSAQIGHQRAPAPAIVIG